MNPEVLSVVREMAAEAMLFGARAAMVLGSHARGDWYPESDVDLTVIGADREGWVERRRGFLVSVSWRSARKIRESMHKPAEAGGVVGGLRSAYIVEDPQGVAAALKAEAEAWTWDSISRECDAWAAEQITSLAEDVQRMVGHYRLGNRWVCAVFKGVLSARLAMILAPHLRIVFDSENRVWSLVAQRMGEPWASLQAAALSTAGETYDQSYAATVRLYSIAVETVLHVMDARQRDVVLETCRLSG